MELQKDLLEETEHILYRLNQINFFEEWHNHIHNSNSLETNLDILCQQNYIYLDRLMSNIVVISGQSAEKFQYQQKNIVLQAKQVLCKQINGFCLNQVPIQLILKEVDISLFLNNLVEVENLLIFFLQSS